MTHAILLTGASGMLGSRAAEALCQRGHRVIGVDLAPQKCVHPNYTHVKCDLTRPAEVKKLFDEHRVDRVVHLAALAHVTNETDLGWNRYFRLNVLISHHVFENAGQRGIPVFFSSTVDVYGMNPLTISEETPLCPVGGYAKSKALAEARLYALMGKTPFMVARFAPVYTEDDHHDIQKRYYLKYPNLAFRVGKGTRYHFLAIARAVEAICAWADRDEAPRGAAIFADEAAFDSAELIAREKAEGRAKRVLKLPEFTRKLGLFAAKRCPTMLRLNVTKVLRPQRFDLSAGDRFLKGGEPAPYRPQSRDLTGVRVLVLEGFARQVMALLPALKKLGCHVTTYNASKLDVGHASRWPDVKLTEPWDRDDEEASFEALMNVLRRDRYDVVIPTTDFSARLLADHIDEISLYAHPAENGENLFYRVMNKQQTMRFCDLADVPHPKTWYDMDCLEDVLAANIEYPFVIKPRIGYGGIGFKVIHDEAELSKRFERMMRRFGPMLAQEYIPQTGKQYQCQVFMDEAGEAASAVLFDKTRWYPVTGGSSCCNTTLHDERIVADCVRLLKTIGWRGYADVDLIQDPRDGLAKVMEINPRVTGGVKIVFMAGVDAARQIVELAMGMPVTHYPDYRDGVRLRFMHTDVLWLLQSPNRFKTKPGWFDFRHTSDMIFSIRDPWPWVTFTVQGLRKRKAEMAKRT